MIDGSKNDIKNQKRTSLKNVKVSAGGALAPPAFYFSIDSTRRFRTQSTDANGVTTEYGYDSATAHLLRTTAANGTQQEYRYYAGSDRTAFTYIGGTASIDYVYDRAQLTDLIRKAYLGTTGYWQHYLLGYDAFGNMTRVQVCASSAEREGYTTPIDLATYEYEGNVYNGRLAKMAYGNGDSVSYTYDAFDRQRTAAYNDVDRTTHERKNVATYHYDYSSDNALTRQYATGSDGKITEQYSYQYDSLGRLIHSRQSTADGSLIQLTQHMYDDANRMTSQTWQFGTGLYRQQYTYTGQNSDDKVDGTISAITTTVPGKGAITSKYEYNDLRQLKSKTVKQGDTSAYTRSYTYDRIAVDSGCNWMGTRLASTGYTFGSNSRSFTYTYDDSGNITRIVLSGGSLTVGTKSKTYSYDALGQLVKEAPGGLARNAVNYTYDTAGNIRSITKGNTSSATLVKSFGYTNPSWPDLLTSVTANGTTKDVLYEGQSKTSDLPTSGNPVTYYNGRDYHFDWSKGRQLTEAVVGGQTVKYAYDMAGVRSSKQVGDTTYSYATLSGKVMRQAWGDNNALEFVYDDSSQPFAVIYKHGSAAELYYYLVNAQGDVAAILDSSGTMVAFYDYDAWGNCTVYNSSAKVLTDPTSIANINPLRYRGYYYDAETGFYYLQSRYYDPAICRFINADGLFTDGFVGSNLFAYCVNDPVNTVDPTGNFAITATVALITFGIALVATAFAVGISSSPGFQEAVEGLCESVGDIAEQIKEKLTNSFSKIKKPPNYRSNKEVHHIVAQRAPGAAPAQKILADLEIGIDEPVNKVSISTCLHRRLHTKLYYELVNVVIAGAYNSAGGDREQQIENVTSALKAIRSFIFVLDRTTPKF